MSGPTTTGSIDAKLTVDDSDFKRGMAEAKVEAKEVGALEPTVKVDANVGPALAKLDAVALAERNLDAAYQRSAISQEKLDQISKKYGEDSVQAAGARLTLARATNAESDAEAKLAGLRHQSTDETEKSTEATNRATQANQRHISGIGVLIAMAPAILAAAAPIAAGAVGLGAAFGVMAVSGVLAIKGIKDAMVDGDAAGNAYATGLGALKGNLDQLASTSANGMLGGFNQAVGDINTKMPFLTQITGQFSGLLGQMGSTALRGVLDGLQQMNPLLQAGGVELSKFVTWLTSFSNTNGFQQFVSYAIENLPSVMHLIESLVTTAGHILAAFAPLGPVVIGFLTALSDGLSSLPLPVLAGLVTTATTIAPALRIAGAAMAWFGVESSLAIPVVGIFVAALAGIGLAAVTAAQGTDQGTQSFQDYTQALRDDNEALGQHVRLQAAKALSDAGAYDAARTLGVSQTVLTDALMGVAGAQDIVNDAIKRGREFQNDWSQGVVDGSTGIYIATDAQNKMGGAIDTVTNALGTQRSSIERGKQINADMTAATTTQTVELQRLASQYGTTVAGYQAATAAQQSTADQLAQTTANMVLQNDAAGLLKQAWDALNGKTISAAQAQNAFDSSLVTMTTHVDKAGNKITFTTASIGDMSAASVALRGQLNGQVTNLERVIEANGGLQNATAQSKQQYASMRQQIIDNAVAHGVNRAAVTAYIDKLFQIPTAVNTKLDADTAAANAKIAYTKFLLDSLHNKTVFVDVQTSQSVNTGRGDAKGSDKPTAYAHGGMVNYLAGGGFPSFTPQGTDTVPAMLTPGEIVMKRASVASLGAGNLLEANRSGKWPAQQQQAAQLPPIYVQNPFTGEYLLAQVDGRADQRIHAADTSVQYQRRGR
jgi:hypothetical protein